MPLTINDMNTGRNRWAWSSNSKDFNSPGTATSLISLAVSLTLKAQRGPTSMPIFLRRRNSMGTAITAREGFVGFHGHKVWHRIVGGREDPGKLPLLCLHGGPGAPHDYLEPIEAMVAAGRRIIFYDQRRRQNSI
jgi:hypothetical protein